jgi:hypothetical protein
MASLMRNPLMSSSAIKRIGARSVGAGGGAELTAFGGAEPAGDVFVVRAGCSTSVMVEPVTACRRAA